MRTASVASGVTSRGEGPVPPVVTTKQQPSWSHCEDSMAVLEQAQSNIKEQAARCPRGIPTSSLMVCSMSGRSSGMTL